MNEVLKFDSVLKAFAGMVGLGSVGLIFYGMVLEPYWAGFGLILLATSILMMISLTYSRECFIHLLPIRLWTLEGG